MTKSPDLAQVHTALQLRERKSILTSQINSCLRSWMLDFAHLPIPPPHLHMCVSQRRRQGTPGVRQQRDDTT